MRLLDRYVARELLGPFIFGVAMFTAIFLGASVLPHLAKLVIQGGSSLEALWIFLLSLPGIMVVTFPMAMLLAALLGFGRLSSELELVAALAAGVSLRRMAAPVLAAAVGVAVLDFAFQESLVPRCSAAVHRLVDGIRGRTTGISDRSLLIQVPDPGHGPPRMVVHARRLRLGAGKGRARAQEGTLLAVSVVYLSKEGKPGGLAFAEEARYDARARVWRLRGMTYYVLPEARSAGPEGGSRRQAPNPVRVEDTELDLGKAPSEIGRAVRPPDSMTVRELRRAIMNLTATGVSTSEHEVQLHQRFAVPFAAIVFALVGVPLGLRRQRTASSLGLGLSVLIIFVYYILWHYLGTLGKGGAMDAFLAAWIPNAIGLAVGAVLLQRAPK